MKYGSFICKRLRRCTFWRYSCILLLGASLAQAQLWSPALLPNGELRSWYDASDTNTLWQDAGATTPVTANSQTVLRWNDKSGYGNDITSSSEPAYATGVMNALPVVRFSANIMANVAASMGNATDNFTVITSELH